MPIQNFIARKNELPSYEIIEIHVNFKIKNYLGTLTLAPILGAFSKFLMIILTDFFFRLPERQWRPIAMGWRPLKR